MLLIFRQLFRCRVTTGETATVGCGLRSLPPSHHKPQLWPLATSLVGVPELSATAAPCITTTGTDRLTRGFKSLDFPAISDSPDNPTCCCSTTSNILFCLVILQCSLGPSELHGLVGIDRLFYSFTNFLPFFKWFGLVIGNLIFTCVCMGRTL